MFGDRSRRQSRLGVDAAGANDRAAKPVAAQRRDQSQHPLLVPAEPRGRYGDPGRIAESHHHVEVVGDALQLGMDHSCHTCARRRGHISERLDGVGERQRVGDRRDALHPFGDQDPVGHRQRFEPLGDTAMLVVWPNVQMRDVLAGRFDEEFDRFEHP